MVTSIPAGAQEPEDDGPDSTDLVEPFVAVDDVVFTEIDEAVDIDVTDDQSRLVAVGRGCYSTTLG